MTDADVIIAGAGPAGSLAAYELASRNVSVLVLEKSPFPRYKVCGAGLTHKILDEIPFDISPVIETRIHQVIFSTSFDDVFERNSEKPMLYCTTRDRIDAFLLGKAVSAGAEVRHGIKVTGVIREKGSVKVVTSEGTFRSELLIGADGASSAVARSAGLRENILPGLAWEAEVRADPAAVSALSQTVFLDWGSFPGGYGWVFPKSDHFSIGVGGPAALAKWMRPYYQRMLGYLDSPGGIKVAGSPDHGKSIHVLETMSLKSWPIPVRVRKSRFHDGRILVTGDAAGLTDPLTGEGIYYAVRSGRLAAETCHRFLNDRTSSLQAYTESVNKTVMPELLEANRIRYLFNTFPHRIHHFVRDNDRAWRAFAKILRGERAYADVPGGFGRWKDLWGAACFASKMISDYKESRFAKEGFK